MHGNSMDTNFPPFSLVVLYLICGYITLPRVKIHRPLITSSTMKKTGYKKKNIKKWRKPLVIEGWLNKILKMQINIENKIKHKKIDSRHPCSSSLLSNRWFLTYTWAQMNVAQFDFEGGAWWSLIGFEDGINFGTLTLNNQLYNWTSMVYCLICALTHPLSYVDFSGTAVNWA